MLDCPRFFAMRVLLLFSLISGLGCPLFAQADVGADAGAESGGETDCGLTVSGRLISEHDDEPLGFANVFVSKPEQSTLAATDGTFRITDLCPGPITLTFTHVGCENKVLKIANLRGDTTLEIRMHHHDNYTETVVVTSADNSTYTIERDALAVEQLADGLERTTGVSTLRTGSSVSKPVVDGVFGNRLSIQNNGIAQSGQQWGNDHAPEIDAWTAAYVRVITGVEALRYAGSTVAATVLVEPATLRADEEAAGKVQYGWRGNGRGHRLGLRQSGRLGRLAYRASASGVLEGTYRTPDYFLSNTGRKEANAALQLAYFHNDRWTSRAYVSTYNADIGVLRGSHIGNLTDLEQAIGREEPFFTADTFTYNLQSPRQAVNHQLLKVETEYQLTDAHRLTLRYGGQINDRREFDVRRGNRSDRAALNLRQFTNLVEGEWRYDLAPNRHLDASVQGEIVYNDNVPGTGVFPLLPDYNGNRQSAYLAYHDERDPWRYHLGLRYDRQFYEAIVISRDVRLPDDERISRFEHVYSTLGGSAEVRRRLGDRISLSGEVTYRERAPQINELYSQGLHQGVSSIEEGDSNLQPERSLKATLNGVYAGPRLTLSGKLFAQPIRDYIFLQPQPDFRLTVRGAFPLFLYRAGDVMISGLNFQANYVLAPGLSTDLRYARVRGFNRSEGRPLVFVPPDNLRLGLRYELAERWTVTAGGFFVARQDRLDPEQDFLAPPPAYALAEAAVGYRLALPRNRTLHLRAAAQNLLNTRYRDYLDRQRYFADAPGRSINVLLSYEW